MKILAINGSPRKHGTISTLIQSLLEGAQTKNHSCEHICLYDYEIQPCKGCWACATSDECTLQDDFAVIYAKIKHADLVILGVPCYWSGVPGHMKNFLDRHLAPAMWKPKNAQNFKSLPSRWQKIKTMLYCNKHFGPAEKQIMHKKFVIITAGTCPFRYLLGEYRSLLFVLKKFIYKLKGKLIKQVICTDTLFQIKPLKIPRLKTKLFNYGKSLS